MTSHQWRKAFIALAEDIFRELGFPPPAMIFEESLPLSMDLDLEGHQFELLHSDNELADHILVSCNLGAIPQGFERRGFRELMKENLAQMRIGEEYFGVDSETRIVKLMFVQPLSTASAPLLLGKMRSLLSKWHSWEERFFSSDPAVSVGRGDASTLLLAWCMEIPMKIPMETLHATPDKMRERFLLVVNELRLALGYGLNNADPEQGSELAMEMMYGNFDFAVVHSMQYRPESVLMECQFGDIPVGREEAILERLLHMNTALAELDGSAFCIDPVTGNLVYTLPMTLDHLSGESLLRKMTETVWHGRRWLETRFLNETHCSPDAHPDPVQLA